MSFQICIKTDKTLHQLATEIRDLLALPSFAESAFTGEPYCQFEMFGMLVLIHRTDEEDRDPEVMQYPYSLDLQMSFTDHELDTDTIEYRLQPYYAQLLTFKLGLDTAYHEKQKNGRHWQIRYQFLRKNPRWDGSLLYGEEGWEPAVLAAPPSAWRSMHPVF
ncbi:MAG TPA: hypothetical protein DHW02_20080 [Ktedonobacter sp.]|nr:hypothetical protein [Ktedonobacter sp.]